MVTIPAGARSIRVMEQNTSSSYLAVRDTQRRYYLNGHWTVDWPGRHPIAGAILEYKRPYNRPESIFSTGPTNDTLVIEVRYQWTHTLFLRTMLCHFLMFLCYLVTYSRICLVMCLHETCFYRLSSYHSHHNLCPADIAAGLEPRCTLGIHHEES